MAIGSTTDEEQGKGGPVGDRAQSPCNGPRNWRIERLPPWGRMPVNDQSEALLSGKSPHSSQNAFFVHEWLPKEQVS